MVKAQGSDHVFTESLLPCPWASRLIKEDDLALWLEEGSFKGDYTRADVASVFKLVRDGGISKSLMDTEPLLYSSVQRCAQEGWQLINTVLNVTVKNAYRLHNLEFTDWDKRFSCELLEVRRRWSNSTGATAAAFCSSTCWQAAMVPASQLSKIVLHEIFSPAYWQVYPSSGRRTRLPSIKIVLAFIGGALFDTARTLAGLLLHPTESTHETTLQSFAEVEAFTRELGLWSMELKTLNEAELKSELMYLRFEIQKEQLEHEIDRYRCLEIEDQFVLTLTKRDAQTYKVATAFLSLRDELRKDNTQRKWTRIWQSFAVCWRFETEGWEGFAVQGYKCPDQKAQDIWQARVSNMIPREQTIAQGTWGKKDKPNKTDILNVMSDLLVGATNRTAQKETFNIARAEQNYIAFKKKHANKLKEFKQEAISSNWQDEELKETLNDVMFKLVHTR